MKHESGSYQGKQELVVVPSNVDSSQASEKPVELQAFVERQVVLFDGVDYEVLNGDASNIDLKFDDFITLQPLNLEVDHKVTGEPVIVSREELSRQNSTPILLSTYKTLDESQFQKKPEPKLEPKPKPKPNPDSFGRKFLPDEIVFLGAGRDRQEFRVITDPMGDNRSPDDTIVLRRVDTGERLEVSRTVLLRDSPYNRTGIHTDK